MSSSSATAEAQGFEFRAAQAPYQLFMLLLCIAALASLFVQVSAQVSPEVGQILEWADVGLCVVFMIDFCYQLVRAPNRLRYLRTWGWIDFMSSIPVVGVLRVGRLARVARLLRVLRGVRSARMLIQITAHHRRQSAALGAFLLASLLIVCSSIAILQFEVLPNSNIKSAADAVWWAVSTMSTVGYGDYFPVTAEGRIVAVVLMCGGVGIFGTVSALMATWFLSENAGR